MNGPDHRFGRGDLFQPLHDGAQALWIVRIFGAVHRDEHIFTRGQAQPRQCAALFGNAGAMA
ncbi:hypothetical protein D3C78_1994640 [compost metagenome]